MVEAAAKILIDRHTCSCRSCSEASAATIQRFAPAPEKRERLKRCHELLEGCHAALDPDVDEALDKAIQAELEPCDIAGVCPAPAPEEREEQELQVADHAFEPPWDAVRSCRICGRGSEAHAPAAAPEPASVRALLSELASALAKLTPDERRKNLEAGAVQIESFRAAHAPAASVQPACADCGEVHPPGCDAPEPAARDRLGENARDWLNSYSYPDHQDENMVMLLRAELKRVVRDCLAIARNLGGVDCETAMREHWGLK